MLHTLTDALSLVWPPPAAWRVGVEWAALACAPGLLGLAVLSVAGAAPRRQRRVQAGPALERWVQRLPGLRGRWWTHWHAQLRWAGLPLGVAELYLVSLAGGVAGATLCAALLGYPLLAVGGGVVIAFLPPLYVQRRAGTQRLLIAEEAERLAVTLAVEVRAGVDVGRLLERAKLALPPLGPLFGRVEQDYRNGADFALALERLSAWLRLADVERLIGPLKLLSRRGAAIAPLLESAAEQIAADRDRVVALETDLAESRYQFWIVCALTIPLLIALHSGDPAGVDILLGTPLVLLFLELCVNALLLYALVRARTTLKSLYRSLGG